MDYQDSGIFKPILLEANFCRIMSAYLSYTTDLDRVWPARPSLLNESDDTSLQDKIMHNYTHNQGEDLFTPALSLFRQS